MQIIKETNVTITNTERIVHSKMCFKDLGFLLLLLLLLLFLSYEENMISDEEFLLLHDEYSLKNPENLNLWFQHENSRFEVRDRSSRMS